MRTPRSSSLLLALPLLVACGKVTDSEPSELAAGGASESPAGRAAPHPAGGAGTTVEPSNGGAGGAGSVLPPLDAGAAKPDASATPPKPPAADGGAIDEDAGTAPDALCDGSDEMRLVYSSSGGFVQQTFGFTNPYGHSFLLVDGNCRYYAGANYMRGIATGTLTAAEATQLSADLHWTDLDSWAYWGTSRDGTCPDAGGISLMKAKAAVGCSCGCDATAPKGLGEALQKAYEWMQKLASAGKPLDTPVSAIVFESSIGTTPTQPKFDWPLAKSIKSIPNLIVDQSDPKLWMGTGPWARFDEPGEFMKLREMRTMTMNTDRPNSGSVAQNVIVREGGTEYYLFVRDELPSAAAEAWKALQATVPMP